MYISCSGTVLKNTFGYENLTLPEKAEICLNGSLGRNEIVTVFPPHPNTSSKISSSDVIAPLSVAELFINLDRASGTVCCFTGL